jgi:hypothetical protein
MSRPPPRRAHCRPEPGCGGSPHRAPQRAKTEPALRDPVEDEGDDEQGGRQRAGKPQSSDVSTLNSMSCASMRSRGLPRIAGITKKPRLMVNQQRPSHDARQRHREVDEAEAAQGVGAEAARRERLIDQALRIDDDHPAVGPHQEIGPERQQDDGQQDRLAARARQIEPPRQRIADQQANRRRGAADPDRAKEDPRVNRAREQAAGMQIIGAWSVISGDQEGTLIYLLGFDSLDDRMRKWEEFHKDAWWNEQKLATRQKEGPLERISSRKNREGIPKGPEL